MRKDLLRVDIRFFTQGFHFPPYICAAYRFAGSRYKNHTAFNILLYCIAEQFLLQIFYNKHRPSFRLAGNGRFTLLYSLDRYILQLGNSYSRAANSLQN